MIEDVADCWAEDSSHPLDQELVRRLNLLASPAGKGADNSGSTKPVLIESVLWLALGILIWSGALLVLA